MLVVVAAVVRREQEFWVLGGQARAQRLVVAQHSCQVLGLLAQLLHLFPQGSVLLLQALALLGGEKTRACQWRSKGDAGSSQSKAPA